MTIVIVKSIFEVILLKKVNAKIDNNGYVECGYCGCSTVEYDENGKVKLSNNFVTTKDGFGLNFPSVRSIYSEELKKELTELTIVCKNVTQKMYIWLIFQIIISVILKLVV